MVVRSTSGVRASMIHPDITLTPKELELLAKINFNWKSHDELRDSLEPMEALAFSILGRGVVPQVRLAYFTEPNCNPGARGKSRQEIFEKNGTSGEEIMRHPHFLKYLEYFIFGPDLPTDAINKFKKESFFSGYLTGSDVNGLTAYARSCVRQNRLDPHQAGEEFFKLALECGAMPGFAETVRNSVRSVKLS